jgi:hypothetical protein
VLLWELEKAPALRKVLPNIIRMGLPLPKAAVETPELQVGLDFYMEAFIDLGTCRGGMGDGPIPWHHCMAYADNLELDQEETDDLWYIIAKLDEAWLEYQERKRNGGKQLR